MSDDEVKLKIPEIKDENITDDTPINHGMKIISCADCDFFTENGECRKKENQNLIYETQLFSHCHKFIPKGRRFMRSEIIEAALEENFNYNVELIFRVKEEFHDELIIRQLDRYLGIWIEAGHTLDIFLHEAPIS